jgi:hypothetical protein
VSKLPALLALACLATAAACGEAIDPSCPGPACDDPAAGAPDAGPADPGDDPDDLPDSGPGDPDQPGSVELSLSFLPTAVRDERVSIPGFDAAGRLQTVVHGGPALPLGGAGCPDVFKHAYLLFDGVPVTESPANPLRFAVRLESSAPALDLDRLDFQVRRRGSADPLTDEWEPIAASEAGARAEGHVDLTVDLVDELATTEAEYEIDVRGRDLHGNEVVATRCFSYHPLAGPLRVDAPVAASGGGSLAGLRLDQNAAISPLLNGVGQATVMTVPITNPTSRQQFVTLTPPTKGGSCTKTWQEWTVPVSRQAVSVACTSPASCPAGPLPAPIDREPPVPCDPTLASSQSRFAVQLLDGATLVPRCLGCGPDQYRLAPNRTYQARYVALALPGAQPRDAGEPAGTYGEHTVSFFDGDTSRTMRITGQLLATLTRCTRRAVVNEVLRCSEMTTFRTLRALTSVAASLTGVELAIAASVAPAGPPRRPIGVPAAVGVGSYGWSTQEAGVPQP